MLATFQLKTPRFINPTWINRIGHGQHKAVVQQNGTIQLDGETLQFTGQSLEPGTEVQVWTNYQGFFICARMDDIEQERLRQQQDELAKQAALREKRNAIRHEAEAFNARIALPFRWNVGIKDVLSGLSESSWGDGRSKATVEHILLQEPVAIGRLVRNAGDFLCSASNQDNGKRWSAQVASCGHDGDGKPFAPKVSCKSCLRLAERWIQDEDDKEASNPTRQRM